ncbi:histidine kinase [Actinoplanes sp. NEAU-A12]|uniref:histidine kinase n=1 Tax=Actinoplanes sandaracinus TaxID=3045177 RepID=A0ABT6WMY9_9ACTN|nr:histidine kinase [Actinoplanes sandaracinus]MDI6101056.1 histidine kinase [Actinoplanes sandaracinus]
MIVGTAQQALTQRPAWFLRSSWPWRSWAYLALGAVVGSGALVSLYLPLLFAFLLGKQQVWVQATGLVVILPVSLLASGLLLGRFERWRLRLIDPLPLPKPPRQPAGVSWSGRLRDRLRKQATWREVGFAVVCLCGLYWLDGALAALGALLLILPTRWLTSAISDGALDFTRVFPVLAVLVGLVVFVLVLSVYAYLITGWANARAAITRTVLAPRDAELGERLVELSRSRVRLVDAFESERRRIERDLHDGAQQRLVALTMTLGLARLDVTDDSPMAGHLDAAHQQATDALTELQELIRGVHPEVLTGRGLPAAIEDLAGRSVLPVEADIRLPGRLTTSIEATAYFVVCEALANAARHAGAGSATVRGSLVDGLLVIEVSDDGVGGADPSRGSGLSGLVDRIAVFDGRLLLSSPPGGPTVVRMEIPCPPTVPSG